MKIRLILFTLLIIGRVCAYGQVKDSPFGCDTLPAYDNGKTFIIYPKERDTMDSFFDKGFAALIFDNNGTIKILEDCSWIHTTRAKPFQKLIDKGVFTKERMKELAINDETWISPHFDETGVIKYLFFTTFDASNYKKSLLTQQELLLIYEAYKGEKYDLSELSLIINSDKEEKQHIYRPGEIHEFYSFDNFKIPYADLNF